MNRKVIINLTALPIYRRKLFLRLADIVGPEFAVYTSRLEELGVLEEKQKRDVWHHEVGTIYPIVPGLEWQFGALSIPISKGDILVLGCGPRTLSSLPLLIKGKFKGARVVWWGQYWSSTSKPWRAMLRFIIMRFVDAAIIYTDREISEFRTYYGWLYNKPIYALNNGIETKEIKKLRTFYSLTLRPRDILFIGRTTKKAQLDLLLDALAQSECAAVTLDIIGDGPEANDLKRQATALGISKRIVWHGAMTDEIYIARIANRCKAFAYPGDVGLSIVHGFAYGLPAIVHNNRWKHMPEIAALQPGKNGIVFRKDDAHDLARKISRLLNSDMNIESMSSMAIETTEQSFNISDMAVRFMKTIDDIDKM